MNTHTHSYTCWFQGVEADHAKAKANNLHGFVAVALVFGLVGLSVDNIPLLQSNDLVGKDASLANSFCSSCKVKVDIHAFVVGGVRGRLQFLSSRVPVHRICPTPMV